MAAKHWLIGCGSGCLLILLISIGLGVVGTLFVRDTFEGFEAALESREVIEERFGRVRDFTPWPEGAIPRERLEAFLAVRESTTTARTEMTEAFSALPMSEEAARELESKSAVEKVRSIFGIVGSAVGLGGHLGKFFEARNQALLEQEMGMGEYAYIYVIAYNAWLGHSPDDSPENARIDARSGDVRIGRGDDDRGSGGHVASRVRGELRTLLQNQLGALPEGADADWRRQLVEQIEAMRKDHDRIPWQDELPERIATSLEPFRDRLEATYNPATNQFELLRNKRQGNFSITAD